MPGSRVTSRPGSHINSPLVCSFNHSLHRSVKTEPALVNKGNERKVWRTLYDDTNSIVKHIKYKFKIGDQRPK